MSGWSRMGAGGTWLRFVRPGKLGRALVTSEPGTDTKPRLEELERHDPNLLLRLRSPGSRVETAIIFANRTKSDVFYYWIDFEVTEVYYGSFAPGTEVIQHTFDGHMWVAMDPNGTSLAEFRASETPGRALITSTW